MNELTQDHFWELLEYDLETGVLTWRYCTFHSNSWNAQWAGKVAGGDNGNGYIGICIEKEKFLAHRVIWFGMQGEWIPQIDHKDLNGFNNAWSNLRSADFSTNQMNIRAHTDNQTGYKGVWYSKQKKAWIAEIVAGNKRRTKQCATPEAAYAAYREMALDLHKHFARSE